MIQYMIQFVLLNQEGLPMPVTRTRKTTPAALRKERVLIEFPASLLKRADQAARELDKNRSELIRSAVEMMLADIEAKQFEQELAAAYAANAPLGLGLAKEFAHIDSEGF
jgi:metal-responsive CopG/Arc/MetJ family transcriptional regulator